MTLEALTDAKYANYTLSSLTRTVEEWRRSRLPEMQKRPAIFIVG